MEDQNIEHNADNKFYESRVTKRNLNYAIYLWAQEAAGVLFIQLKSF